MPGAQLGHSTPDSVEDPDEGAETTGPYLGAEHADTARMVTALLDARRIHALDGLLLRRAKREPELYADAELRCDRFRIGGLGEWRLPTAGELRVLRRARLLPAGAYWASGKWRGGSRVALSRDRTYPIELGESEPGASTMCVRDRDGV